MTALLFDAGWYLEQYADASREGGETTALEHYISAATDGRMGTPFFDAEWYMQSYPGVAHDALSALEYFISEGSEKGHNPTLLFDETWYRSRYLPAGLPAGFVSGYHHFLETGAAAGYNPSLFFDERWYRHQYPDVPFAIANGLLRSGFHDYVRKTSVSERMPNPYFDPDWFRQQYPALAESDRLAYLAYLRHAGDRAYSPSRLFDELWYRKEHPDVLLERFRNGFHHFLAEGAKLGLAPSPYFLPHWYRSWYPMVEESLARGDFEHPFEHYLKRGAADGLSPNPWFNETWYLHNNPEIAAKVAAGEYTCGHAHYLTTGAREGRTCSTVFDADWYWQQYPEVIHAVEKELVSSSYEHYCRYGRKALYSGTGDFDEYWYRREYPDVSSGIAEGMWVDGLHHFVSAGIIEGRYPTPTAASASRSRNSAMAGLADRELRHFIASGERLTFPSNTQPRVSILLVSFHRPDLTLRCLRSIQRWATDVSYEIVLVDNASNEETQPLLDGLEGVTVARNAHNEHFLRAANQAARMAKGEYLLFLNNDAELQLDAIRSALSVFDVEDNVGAVGGKIILQSGVLQEAGSYLLKTGMSMQYGRGQQPFQHAFMHRRDVPYCSGAFLMTAAALFRELGGFDDAFYPAYCEDSDYCLRLWNRGLRVIYNPDSIILHHETGSSRYVNLLYPSVLRNIAILRHRYQEYFASLPNEASGTPISSLDGLRPRRAHLIVIPSIEKATGLVTERLGAVIAGIRKRKGFVTLYSLAPWNRDRSELPSFISADVEVAGEYGAATFEDFCRSRKGMYEKVIAFGSVDLPLRALLPESEIFSDRDSNALGRYLRAE